MGFMDKLQFWKKKEEPILETAESEDTEEKTDLGLNEPLNLEAEPGKATSEFINAETAFESDVSTPLTQPGNLPGKHAGAPTTTSTETDSTELLSSKLDAIKANMENINLRLTKIETHMEDMKNKKSW